MDFYTKYTIANFGLLWVLLAGALWWGFISDGINYGWPWWVRHSAAFGLAALVSAGVMVIAVLVAAIPVLVAVYI